MTDLFNYQWELDGVVFGMGTDIEHEADVAPGEASWRTQDQSNPNGDGMIPGRDKIDPGVWSFKLWTNCDSEGEALAAVERLAGVWMADDVRSSPGKVLPLRYRLNDRTRVVYGRPRRFAAPLSSEFHSGRIAITCDFQTVSHLFFDDAENSLPRITAMAPTIGGFETPIVTPLSTLKTSVSQPNTFTVGGSKPTPMVIDFHGPSTNALLDIDGLLQVRLSGDVAGDAAGTVTVDARPWVMSAFRADGAGVPGLLSPRTRLPRLLLKPGTHVATYSADGDLTGTSYATIRWHSAYASV